MREKRKLYHRKNTEKMHITTINSPVKHHSQEN